METLAIAASVGLPDLFSSWHPGFVSHVRQLWSGKERPA